MRNFNLLPLTVCSLILLLYHRVGCWCVESSEILMKLESGPLPTVLAVKAAGNILCVLTAKGLCVLDPDSLIAIPMGATEPGKSCSRDVTGSSEDATQFVVPGEFVQLKIFKTSQLSESTKMVALSLDYTFALLTVHVHRCVVIQGLNRKFSILFLTLVLCVGHPLILTLMSIAQWNCQESQPKFCYCQDAVS